jgi:hypothetical protein
VARIKRALLLCAALAGAASCEMPGPAEVPTAAPARTGAPLNSAIAPQREPAAASTDPANIDRRIVEIGATLRALDERLSRQSHKGN